MSDSPDNAEKMADVVLNYIEPSDVPLHGLNIIHERLFGENPGFSEWAEAAEAYRDDEWTDQQRRDFIVAIKQRTEDGTERIPEVYLNIVDPVDLTLEKVEAQLSEHAYDDEAEKSVGGFKYSIEGEDTIRGRYIYGNINTALYFGGEVDRFVQEHSVPFRIHPEQRLLIIESTGVVNFQKAKSAFSKETSFGLKTCGALTKRPQEAPALMDAFRKSFEVDDEDEVDFDTPIHKGTKQVRLYNPEQEEETDIEKMELEGGNIADNDYIDERLDEQWVIKGVTMEVRYKEAVFDVVIMGGERMSYGKIESITNYEKGQELMDIVRERYMDHFRRPLQSLRED